MPPGFGAPYLIKNNFIVAGGGANGGCADNDDGSSFYEMDSNACIYGAKKSDFNGHSKRDANNIHLFANVYGAKCVGIMDLPTKPGFYEAYHGNVCVLVAGGAYMDLGANCETTSLPAFNVGFLAGNNTVYVDGSGGSVTCGKTYPYAQWAALGLDPGTTLSTTLPTSATMITWVRQLLGY